MVFLTLSSFLHNVSAEAYECFLCSNSLVADTLQEPGWLFQYVIVVRGLACLPIIMLEASKILYILMYKVEMHAARRRSSARIFGRS